MLYVEEDWPLNTTLDVQICSAKFAASALAGQSEIRIVSGNIGGKFQLAYEGGKCATLKLMKRVIQCFYFIKILSFLWANFTGDRGTIVRSGLGR